MRDAHQKRICVGQLLFNARAPETQGYIRIDGRVDSVQMSRIGFVEGLLQRFLLRDLHIQLKLWKSVQGGMKASIDEFTYAQLERFTFNCDARSVEELEFASSTTIFPPVN